MNADHKYLIAQGWTQSGENRIGNRVQFLWTHPRHGERTFTTATALYSEAIELKKRKAEDAQKGEK